MENKILHSQIFGAGKPFVVLHGLFGMSDNWRTFGRKLSGNFEIHLVDQRNHGRSFHTSEHNYDLMAEDLFNYLNHHSLSGVILLGHSMGGKTVMHFAQKYPELVKRLIVVDIAPKFYPDHHQGILNALLSVDINSVKSRGEVQSDLESRIPSPPTVQFLMKNVYRKERGGFGWRINVTSLNKYYSKVMEEISFESNITTPTLFIAGGKSGYITEMDKLAIQNDFETVSFVTIPNAGHWVHAENLPMLLEEINEWLGN